MVIIFIYRFGPIVNISFLLSPVFLMAMAFFDGGRIDEVMGRRGPT